MLIFRIDGVQAYFLLCNHGELASVSMYRSTCFTAGLGGAAC